MDRRTDGRTETEENCPMWNHRSSALPGPLPKKERKEKRDTERDMGESEWKSDIQISINFFLKRCHPNSHTPTVTPKLRKTETKQRDTHNCC